MRQDAEEYISRQRNGRAHPTDDGRRCVAGHVAEIADGKYTLCPACVDMVKEREREENVALWENLPELLGIDVPGWKDAVAASAAAK